MCGVASFVCTDISQVWLSVCICNAPNGIDSRWEGAISRIYALAPALKELLEFLKPSILEDVHSMNKISETHPQTSKPISN
jgi:hypothetical protein